MVVAPDPPAAAPVGALPLPLAEVVVFLADPSVDADPDAVADPVVAAVVVALPVVAALAVDAIAEPASTTMIAIMART